jgi:DNA-binding NarL/FixJ family response regulator
VIRVAIIADSFTRARNLAELLSEDQRFDVVDARAISTSAQDGRPGMADVIVAAGLLPDQIPKSSLPIVVVTNARPAGMPFMRAVRAWLPLNSSSDEIGAAIIAAVHDLAVFTQDQVAQWVNTPDNSAADNVLIEPLTPRELQVLRMLADGLGNKELAQQLGISEHTAKFHVAQILAKLGAGSRAEAVALGIRRGLVPV